METKTILQGRRIVLGVSGSIAAYKACDLASRLVKKGAEVYPVLTRGGARFVTTESFAALCGRPAVVDEFERPNPLEMTHIDLAEKADAIVLAPASANLIARIATGMANDMLTLMLLASRAPVLLAPAMNTNMWQNPLVAANIQTLMGLGYRLVEPASGRMACGTVGPGKLAEPEQIVDELETLLNEVNQRSSLSDMSGWKVIVTAGPTQEPIDAVRFLGNRSSGKMGYAIARSALNRGASVILITGPTGIDPPAGAQVVKVRTAKEMLSAVLDHLEGAHLVVGAAAVADFTVDEPVSGKLHRGSGPMVLTLQPTSDILETIGKQKQNRIHVGFAAETGSVLAGAQAKLQEKNLDMIVANDITEPGAGFDYDTNRVTFLQPGLPPEQLPLLSKMDVANRLIDRVVSLRRGANSVAEGSDA